MGAQAERVAAATQHGQKSSPSGGSGWLGAPTGETGPLGAQPLPRVRERAASKAAEFPTFECRPRSVCASMAMPDALLLFGGEVSPSDRGHEGAGGFAGDLLAIDPLDGELQARR